MPRPCRSSEVVDTPAQAEELERPPLLVREPLEEWLDGQGIGEGAIEAERIGEGHSNVTYLVRRGDTRLVLRRPPRPPLPPSAHDVLREARLLQALEGTAARRPRVLAACDDEDVLGRALLRDGGGARHRDHRRRARRRSTRPRSAGASARSWSTRWSRSTRWTGAAGLEWFGKPTGYLERQLRRFNGLWEHNKTRELPVVRRSAEWLADNLPESPTGDDRARRLPAGQRDGGRRAARAAWSRCSTGSWPRSATRWPTSAT